MLLSFRYYLDFCSFSAQFESTIFFDTIRSEVDGKFAADPYIGTLKNEGVGLAPYHDFDSKVSDELKAEVKKVIEDIKSGTIKVESPNQP